MEPEHLTLHTYTAEQLEAFTRDPKTCPDQLSGRVLEALMVGHPTTKMPTQMDQAGSSLEDLRPRSRSSSIAQLALCWLRLCSRLLLPFLFLSASVCFLFNLIRDIHFDLLGTLAIGGRRQTVNESCRTYFSFIPAPSVCHSILVTSVLTLMFVAMATKSWAVSVTDHLVRRTIFTASRQIVRRIHHLYGLFHTAELGESANPSQPIIYYAYRALESCLRSRLFMTFCSILTALLCLICLVIDPNYDRLVIRWQVVIVTLLICLICCVLSNEVRQVYWFKVLHLLALAVSLLLINKISGANLWLIILWQIPLQFVQSIRSVTVYNRSADTLENVLKKHDMIVPLDWFFLHLQHISFMYILSFLLKLLNYKRRLNEVEVLFRYNFLLEPVESVTFLVAVFHMPPILTILMLRSQLKLMTPSEVDSLLLIGMTQSLFTSCRPISRGYNDFITNSRQLCTLVPLATVCAIIVGSIANPSREPSKLLLESQARYKHTRALSRGLRRMFVKQTKMGSNMILLLIVAHEVIKKVLFCLRLLISLTVSSTTDYRKLLLSFMHYFLISTGCYMRSGDRLLDLIFDQKDAVEKLLQLDPLLKGSYTWLIRTPMEFQRQASDCKMWNNISSNLAELINTGRAPLMDSMVEHSSFLLLLRITQNGTIELTFFMCMLLVNANHRFKLKLLASLPKTIVLLTLTVGLVFAIVNFVSSIDFY